MKKFLFCSLFLLSALHGSAQIKFIKRMLKEDLDTTRKPSFMVLPALRYSQEVGLEFGLGALYSTYLDKKDPLNRSSNFSSTLTASTKDAFNVGVKGDIWTPHNDYHLISEIRFRSTPFDFYGIGNETLEKNDDKLIQHQAKANFEIEKNILPFTYTGVSLDYEHYSFIDKEPGGIYDTDPAILGKPGGSVIFIGVSQTFDTRNSNNYPSKGFYGRATYQYAPNFFGGNDFTGSQIRVVVRNFWPLAKRLILGVNGIFYTVQSKDTPFYLLPQLGNDEIMRGYYTGRYRDQNLMAAQTELRYRLSNRFGLVAFAGGGRVFANGDFSFSQLKPSVGGGIRYFYDPAKGLSVRADYAVGEQRPGEARQSGFYLGLAEAF